MRKKKIYIYIYIYIIYPLYTYIYIYIFIYLFIYLFIYIERERSIGPYCKGLRNKQRLLGHVAYVMRKCDHPLGEGVGKRSCKPVLVKSSDTTATMQQDNTETTSIAQRIAEHVRVERCKVLRKQHDHTRM